MKIKHNSTWLFFYKIAKEGKYPKNICSWFWNSLLGIIVSIASLYGFVRAAIKKDYDGVDVGIGLVSQSVILLTALIIDNSYEEVSLFMSLVYSMLLIVIACLFAWGVYLAVVNFPKKEKGKATKPNPISQSFKDFKDKHCTLIEIEKD